MNTIVHTHRRLFTRSLLACIAATVSFAAQAAEPGSGPAALSTSPLPMNTSIVVDYADLDLANPDGASALYARLRMAARKVCGHQPPPVGLNALKEYRECYDTALGKAVRRVDSRQLYALHAEHTRKTTLG